MSAATYVHFNITEALKRAAPDYQGWPILITGESAHKYSSDTLGGRQADTAGNGVGRGALT